MLCQLAFCIFKNNTVVLNNISLALFLSSILNDSNVLEGVCSKNCHGKRRNHSLSILTRKLHECILRKVEKDGLP